MSVQRQFNLIRVLAFGLNCKLNIASAVPSIFTLYVILVRVCFTLSVYVFWFSTKPMIKTKIFIVCLIKASINNNYGYKILGSSLGQSPKNRPQQISRVDISSGSR